MINRDESDPVGVSEAGFRPTGRQVGSAIVAVALVVFMAANSNDVEVSLIFVSATLPMWLVLAITSLLSVGVGMVLGTRRTKTKLARRG